jgi:NADP-dependent 3-hydroxy acid dehydrogenase YdfG
VLVTGAASGFGREIATQVAMRGAIPVAFDVNGDGAAETATMVTDNGGVASSATVDVRDRHAFAAAVNDAVQRHGRADVLVNNAGIMPLAFFADHEQAADAWERCIDINLKGVLNGICAVYDHMVGQGAGHIVNISSIYGNAGVAGAGVYGATKAAVAMLSNALRVETQGAIKVTIVRPTGVAGTNLAAGIINWDAPAPLAGHRMPEWQQHIADLTAGTAPPEVLDPTSARYWTPNATELASQVVDIIDQPLGWGITDVTIRATGEDYVY